MVPVTGHAIGTRTGVNRDSNRLGTVTTVQNSNISEWEMPVSYTHLTLPTTPYV